MGEMSSEDIAEILEYITNFDKKGVQVVLLGTPIRSGSLLFHSLLDSHPQILHFPAPFYFYCDWEYFLNTLPRDKLIDDFFSVCRWMSGKIQQLGQNRDITLDLQLDQIRIGMNAIEPYLLEMNRKNFLLLFYLIYAKLTNTDLNQIKVLFLHNHCIPNIFGYFAYIVFQERCIRLEDLDSLLAVSQAEYIQTSDQFLNEVFTDFSHVKIMATIREPLAAMYSTIEYLKGGKLQQELNLYYVAAYYNLIGYYNLYFLKQKLGERFKTVKFEDIHRHPEAVMRDVSAFMGIDYQETLLSSTFGGYLWSGSTATDKIIFGTDPSIINKESAWKTQWNSYTQGFYAKLCSPLASVFGYEAYNVPDALEDLASFTPSEKEAYENYRLYLLRAIAEEENGLKESLNPGAPSYVQELYNRGKIFLENYPDIRKKTLDYLLETGVVLGQYSK